MPRSKNNLLRSFFSSSKNEETACCNGSCYGKILSSHAGNLERHLKTLHTDIYNDYLKKKSSRISHKSKMPKVSCPINKKTAEMAIVELFTKCGRPLRMVEDRPFKIITKPVFDALNIKVNKRYLVEKILKYSCNLKEEISEQLKCRLLSLRVDTAAHRHLSVLGINVQYIENNCITIKTLAIRELKESQTTDDIKAVILEVLNEYQISLKQILTITTDDSANMIKVVKKETNIKMETDDEAQTLEVNELNLDIDFPMNDITNVRCGDNTLQLCVLDVIKAPALEIKLENFRTVCTLLGTETFRKALTNAGYEKPIIDSPTIRNSTYLMMEKIMKLKDFLELLSKDNAVFNLDDDEWNFVSNFLRTFKIIYAGSMKLQSHDLVYSDFYIILMNISLQLESLPVSKMTSSLKRAVNRRKSNLLESDLFLTAVFLDPRIKTTLTTEQIAIAKKCIISIHRRLFSLKENDSKSVSSLTADKKCSPSPSTLLVASVDSSGDSLANSSEDLLEAYLQRFDQQQDRNELSDRNTIEKDLLFYEQQKRLAINENVAQFWSSQKNTLAEIANVVLAIPCTQISLERLFSALEYIFSDQANSFHSKSLEHILLLRANGDFFWEN